MENGVQNVTKKALKVNRVLAMVTAFVIGLGAFCAPMTAFASGGGGGAFFGGSVNKTFTNKEYAQLSYFYTDGGYAYRDFCSGTVTLDSSYKIFRVWVRLTDIVPKGASVNMNFNFSFATGSISSISMWFGEQDGQSASTSVDKSAEYFSTYGNDNVYFVDEPITVLEDATMICFQIVFSARSSNDMYLNFNSINYSYDVVDPSDEIIGNQQEQIEQSKNIFEVVGDIWNSVLNLPNNIQSALTSLFTNLQTAVNNVANNVTIGLSGFLNNIKSAVDNIASGVTDGLSQFFEDIIGTDVVDGSFFEEFQEDAQQNVGDLDDALSSAPDILRPSIEELPNIDEFAPSDDNFIVVIMKRLFGLEIVQTMCLCALTFGSVGYIVFGKR